MAFALLADWKRKELTHSDCSRSLALPSRMLWRRFWYQFSHRGDHQPKPISDLAQVSAFGHHERCFCRSPDLKFKLCIRKRYKGLTSYVVDPTNEVQLFPGKGVVPQCHLWVIHHGYKIAMLIKGWSQQHHFWLQHLHGQPPDDPTSKERRPGTRD